MNETDDDPADPRTYVEVLDFTPAGVTRFADFLALHAPALEPSALALECLGGLEEQINRGAAAEWTLAREWTLEGAAATFQALDGDLVLHAEVLPVRSDSHE